MAGVSALGDFSGRRYGRWTVVRPALSRGRGRRWLCRCDCGAENDVAQRSLVGGKSESCGCLSSERHSALLKRANHRHGLRGTPEYKIWKDIVKRCHNERHHSYRNYGGRGITICQQWRTDPKAFCDYVGKRPDSTLTIDRIDNNGNYEPGNVRWATRKTQRRNSRAIRLITIGDTTRPLFVWLEQTGMRRSRYKARRRAGWTEEAALTRSLRQ